MMCPACQAQLGKINAAGEPMIRGRGMVFKSSGLVMICPKCAGDVPMTGDVAKAIQSRMVLFFKSNRPGG